MKKEFLSKKINNYIDNYKQARSNQLEPFKGDYFTARKDFEKDIGLPYTILGSNNYDPSVINVVVPPLPNNNNIPETLPTPSVPINYWTSNNYNDDLVWGIDRYYLLDIIPRGNLYRIGFYSNSSPLSSSSPSSISKPTFYYESFTGNVVMGGEIVKKLSVNLTSILIRVDSDFNFYVGTSLTNYWLIGKCTSYMEAINDNFYALRWGYEVNMINNLSVTITKVNSAFGPLKNINTEGITWPNHRFGRPINNRWTISDNLTQSISSFNVYPILNKSNGNSNFGERTSFTLKCIESGLEQVLILISSTLLLSNSYNQISDIYTSLVNYIGYDSLSNLYFSSSSNNIAPSSYPDLVSANGQIYFRVEENGNIYSSRDSSNASLISTVNYNKFYMYIITKGYSNDGSKKYSFIPHNIISITSNPINNSNIIPTPVPTPTPPQNNNDIVTPTVPPSGSNTNTLPPVEFNYYTTSIVDIPPIPYGKGRAYTVTFDNVNNFKIGFYSNSIIDNKTKYSTSINPPQFYYNTIDRGVYIGNVLKTVLPYNWYTIYLLVDSSNGFYVGYSESYYIFIDNITNYLNLIFPNTYTLRLGWEIYTSSFNYNINVISSKIIEPQNYIMEWPNNRLFSKTLNDYTNTTEIQNEGGFYTFIKFFNLSNSFQTIGGYTLKSDKDSSSDINIVIYSSQNVTNYTLTSSLTSILGDYLIYNSNLNKYIKNGIQIATPQSFPNLNKTNGQIYVRFQNGQIFSGADISSAVYIGDIIPGVLYGGISTYNQDNYIDKFTFIPSVPSIIPPQIPLSDSFPTVSQAFVTNPIIGVWNLNLTNVLVGGEYIAGDERLENSSWAYGWQSFIYGTPTNVNTYKLGVGMVSSTILRYIDGNGIFFPHHNTSNITLYIYYDSVTGNVHVDNTIVKNIGVNLQNIGIGVDKDYNVFFFISHTICYKVGNLSLYASTSKCQFSAQIHLMFTPSISNPPQIFNYDFNVSYNAHKAPYILDDSFNNLIYDPTLQVYSTSTSATSSSSTMYKFLQTTRYCKSSQFSRRQLFHFEVAPTDVILVFGRNTFFDFIPGDEYDANTISNISQNKYKDLCVSYRQSLSGVFINSALNYSINLGLNVDNSSVIVELIGPDTIRIGQNVNNITTVVDLNQITLSDNVDSYYFIGIFVSCQIPCKINVIDVNKLLYPPFVPGGFPTPDDYLNPAWLNPNFGPVSYVPPHSLDYKLFSFTPSIPSTMSTTILKKVEMFRDNYIFLQNNGDYGDSTGVNGQEYFIFGEFYTYGAPYLIFHQFYNDYKYGIGYTGDRHRHSKLYLTQFAIPSNICSMYYYYNKSNGVIYRNNIPIYQFDVGLTYIGMGIDVNLNVYIAKSDKQVYFIGDLLDYANNNNVQSKMMIGMSFVNNTSLDRNVRLGRLLDNYKLIVSLPSILFPYNLRHNFRLYDTISSNYKTTSYAASSSTLTYKYLEFTWPVLNSETNRNYFLNFELVTAPSDFIIGWGSSEFSFIPGENYTYDDVLDNYVLVYVSSSQSFYYEKKLVGKTSNLPTGNGSTIFFKILNNLQYIEFGQSQYSTVKYNVLPPTRYWWTISLTALYIQTSSPTSLCQIDIL